MRRIITAIILVITSALMLTGCKGKTIKINGDDNGSIIELKKGETLELSIRGNTTTGYSWKVESVDENVLKPLGVPYYEMDSNMLDGSGGTFIFTYTAANIGTTDLKLIYWRSFEPENPPVETYEVTVIVQ